MRRVREWVARQRKIPTPGLIALAAFLLCVATGIALVPVFRPAAALDSLALLELKNPYGIYLRSLHNWSAELCLLFTLAHGVEHLLRRSERRIQFGVWVRLCLSVPVLIAAMLSGFLLRGDVTAAQALHVLRAMLAAVPRLGGLLTFFFTGAGGDLTTVYLHHAATATVILLLVIVEHVRRIAPGGRAWWWSVPPVAVLALLFVPAMDWRGGGVEKGPWYLLGLQELLHWLAQPQAVLLILAVPLVVAILLPRLTPRAASRALIFLAMTAVLYAGLSLVAYLLRGEGWALESPVVVWRETHSFLSARVYAPPAQQWMERRVPMIAGRREGCLVCHSQTAGLSQSHDPAVMGCASCHLGNPFTLDATAAHAGMTRTPGNLSVAEKTCATSNCHAGVLPRVNSSLMNTMSGVVAVDRWAFGETAGRDAHFNVAELQHTPAEEHLRQLCASCHTGAEKELPGPLGEQSRGGGCSACHLRYDAQSAEELRSGFTAGRMRHPEITVRPPQVACEGCHSRSGRIAMNYEGWHETQLDLDTARKEPGWPARFRVFSDGRVFERRAADVHFEKGMGCTDCHFALDVMGDGVRHAHEEDAVHIACVDCHLGSGARSVDAARLDAETGELVRLLGTGAPGRKFLLAGDGGSAYPNAFVDAGGKTMVLAGEGRSAVEARAMSAACSLHSAAHSHLRCESCHAQWAPQCIDCHTTYDSKAEAWDHLAQKFVRGGWEEEGDSYLSDAPVLGVVVGGGAANGVARNEIASFIPGMIWLHGDESGAEKTVGHFERLYAPTSPHTIGKSRDCKTCHANPAALGYGRGKLTYVVGNGKAEWRFEPQFAARAEDGLPRDAWIAFLKEPTHARSTRANARPFSLEEQRRILLVGACLECHSEKEKRVVAAFADFHLYRKYVTVRCILPDWAR